MGEKAIRIGFNGNTLIEGEIRGFSRYTIELIRALKKISKGSVIFYSFSTEHINPIFQETLNLNEVVFPAKREVLWEQYELPKQIKEHKIELFHATANRGLPLWRVCKYILTRHDIIENLPRFSVSSSCKSALRRMYADFASMHSADKIIAVSKHSKKDICNYLKIAREKVDVTYEAANERFLIKAFPDEINSVRNKYNLPSDYLLYLGGFDKKKNIPALVEGYRLVRDKLPPLVLAGEKKWDFPIAQQMVQKSSLLGRIIFPGKIDDKDLPALYQGALAFIYPSLYEGFGLQLVEAMASGIPVLASNRTSLPEVLNGAGLLFDPEDPENIAKQIKTIVTNRVLYEELCQKSKERAKFFSWEKTAKETLKVYLKLLGRNCL
jgi:hypothetical protein